MEKKNTNVIPSENLDQSLLVADLKHMRGFDKIYKNQIWELQGKT